MKPETDQTEYLIFDSIFFIFTDIFINISITNINTKFLHILYRKIFYKILYILIKIYWRFNNGKYINDNYILCLCQIYFKWYERRKKKKEIRNKKVTSYNEDYIYAIYMYIIHKIIRLKYYTTVATITCRITAYNFA